MPRITKVLKVAMFSRTDKHKEKSEQETIIHFGFRSYNRVREKQK
jgi:hypothetical protein